MFNRTPKIDDIDLNQDVSQLADTLDDLLKSYASKTEDEMATARSKAESLLKETRTRLNGNGRVSQAARDAAHTTDAWVHDKPWHSVGIGAAVGIFIGALLASRR